MPTVPRARYPLLDALRGVAAIGVVLYHLCTRMGAPALVRHGYLAVDFFFILSGFVVSHAYSERMKDLSFARFFKVRLLRFMPMSVLGVLLGTGYLLVRWHVKPSLSDDLPHLLAASGLNLLLIPKLWVSRATGYELFPADGVLWTLFLELLINLVWARWFVYRKNLSLFATALAGGAVFAFFAWRHGGSDVGWNLETLLGGVGRVTFGFFIGVLVWRFRSHARLWKVLGWSSGAVLIAMLCLPACPWWVELTVVALVFPALVYFAASCSYTDEPLLCRLLADISYPLYAIHVPLVMAASGFIKWKYPEMQVPLSGYLICIPLIMLAELVGRFYDVPLRRWLARPSTGSARTPVASGRMVGSSL